MPPFFQARQGEHSISSGLAADVWDVSKDVYDGVDLGAQVLEERAKTGKALATAQSSGDARTALAESSVDEKAEAPLDEVVKDGREAFECAKDFDVTAAGNDASGIVKDGADSAMEAMESVINGDDDIDDAVTEVQTDVAIQIAQAAGEEVVEEVMGAIPVVGLCKGAYNLTKGAGYAAAGTTSVASALTVGVIGGVAGALASPFDGGKLLRSSSNLARSQAAWGGSVLAEGTSGAIKGTANIVGQVPGTQVVSIPTSFVAGQAAKGCQKLR